MQNVPFKDTVSIAKAAADVICKQLENKPDSLICIAAGHSSLPLFDELIERYKKNQRKTLLFFAGFLTKYLFLQNLIFPAARYLPLIFFQLPVPLPGPPH